MKTTYQLLLYPKQVDFLSSKERYRAFVGGRAAGKSFIGAYDLLTKASAKKDRLYMVVAPTYKVLRDATCRSFLSIGRKLNLLLPGARGFNKTEFRARLISGSEVVFKSSEDPESLRGPNISGLWFDEAQGSSHEAFLNAIACLREDPVYNWCTATFTPKGKRHWTYTTFARKNEYGEYPPNTAIFRSASRENPFLPETFVSDLRSQYTTATQEQELEGEFLDAGGTLFKREWFANKIVNQTIKENRRVRYWDKACLVRGTLITTSAGQMPIEDVLPGMLVLTRRGWRAVKKSWKTKEVSEVVTVYFSDGSSLTGTDDHRVWTQNRGWVFLAELTGSDVCLGATESRKWESASRNALSTREFAIGERRDANTLRLGGGTRRRNDTSATLSTERSGENIMEIFPTAMMFTTRTTTQETMRLRILSASRTEITCDHTGRSGQGVTLWTKWSHGQKPRAGRKYCEPMAERAFRAEGDINTNAAIAELGLNLWTLEGQNDFVRQLAQPESEGKIAVYDLMIDDVPEFFANGVLVHNSTQDGGCFTCGTLISTSVDGRYFIESVIRGQWSTFTRDEIIKLTAELDQEKYGYGGVRIGIEEEGGSGGKDSMRTSIRHLAGHIVQADKVTGDKRVRAEPFAAQVEAGNVFMVNDDNGMPWIENWIDELVSFPEGKICDQVDSASGAFNMLVRGSASKPVTDGASSSSSGSLPTSTNGDYRLLGIPAAGQQSHCDLRNFKPR